MTEAAREALARAGVELPQDWTSAQIAKFQEAWDEHIASAAHQVWRPPEPRPQIVLHFWWQQGSLARQQTYGLWAVTEDEAHLAQIHDFLRDWRRLTGIQPDSVTMALVAEPREWVREHESATVGATVSEITCRRCGTATPVECRDVTGMTLDGIVAAARQLAEQACPAHGQLVLVGAPSES